QGDVVLRLAAADAQLPGQAPGAHAVHEAEVDRLGGATLVGTHLLQRQAEDLGGGGTVDVLAALEGAQQALVAAEVGHDAQLDLRVVAGDHLPPRRGDEGGADAAAVLGADRDVLQVRVVGAEPAGGGAGLVVAGVHPAD